MLSLAEHVGMMSDVLSDSLWSRGHLWSAAQIGARGGLGFGLIQFGWDGSVSRALSAGASFGVFFGVWMAFIMWRSWPGAKDLSPTDRVAVHRIVRRGDAIHEARLAPAVLDYVGIVRRAQDREDRGRWMLWIFALGTLILALAAASTRAEVTWWVLVAFWASFLVWRPRRQAQTLAHASRAQAEASRLLQRSPDE
jgi:hypothetical protein